MSNFSKKSIYSTLILLLIQIILFDTELSWGIELPNAAALISPSGTILTNKPTYTWNAVPNTTNYYLWVDDSTGTKIQQWYTAANANCPNGTGTCSVTPTKTLAPGAGIWKIQTKNLAGNGPWSSSKSFTVTLPGAATLVSPFRLIFTNKPTYTWNAVPNTTKYYLWVDDSTGNKIQRWYTAADAGCPSGTGTCSVTPSTLLVPGACNWKIQTKNDAGDGPWSSAKNFRVSPPGVATLVSPSGSITTNKPIYTWNAVPNATKYCLKVNDLTGTVIEQWYTAETAGCPAGTGTCSVTPGKLLTPGSCTWMGQTLNDAGDGPWSSPMSFIAPTMPSAGFSNIFIGGDIPVDGVMIYASWSEIEPSEGFFIWGSTDDQINNAVNSGKKVVLNLMASGINTPDWVMSLPGVQLFNFVDINQYHKTYCQELTMPVFWDPIFLEKKKNFIWVAGERYAANDSILGVMVSFCNPILGDWWVPHEVGYFCGQDSNKVQDWLTAGYTTEKMLNAGKETIDTWATSFPNKMLKLPVSVTHRGLDGNATNLAELIMNYAYSQYPDRFFAQSNGLSSKTLYSNDPAVINAFPGDPTYLYKLLLYRSPQIGLQMLSSASNGVEDNCRLNGGDSPCPPYDVLFGVVDIGLSYNPHYIECSHADAENPELQPILDYIKENLR